MNSAKLKQQYTEYVRDSAQAAELLAFLLENLGYSIKLDYSRSSLVELEQIYWGLPERSLPSDLSDVAQLETLVSQYLGATIILKTGARWTQSFDANPMLGQPCLDGFGNQKWERIYPVALVKGLRNLHKQSRIFPGLKEKQVLAKQFDNAVEIRAGSS